MLRRQTRATGLSESVTLLKSTFKLHKVCNLTSVNFCTGITQLAGGKSIKLKIV